MALAELETAARLELKLLVLIYDDSAYGAEVHHFAPMGHDVSLVRFPDADLAAIATAAGAKAATVREYRRPLSRSSEWLAQTPPRPLVLDAKVNPTICAEWLDGGVSRRLTAPTRLPRGASNHVKHARQTRSRRSSTGLAAGSVEIVDLTQPLTESTPVIKLPPPFVNTPGLTREEISHYDDRGPAWAWYTLTIGEHVGTHVDAPIHWVTGKDGDDIGSIGARDAWSARRA